MPRVRGASPTASSRTSWPSTATRLWWSSETRSQRPRVLIVDDDRSLLSLLRVIFDTAGFDVDTKADASAALDEIALASPDVVVLDLEMPGMNGREFYRRLRQNRHDIPVLILSAYGARAAQIELGAEAYTAKPFDPDDLVASVRRLLEQKPA